MAIKISATLPVERNRSRTVRGCSWFFLVCVLAVGWSGCEASAQEPQPEPANPLLAQARAAVAGRIVFQRRNAGEEICLAGGCFGRRTLSARIHPFA